jgi:hypothetical protein
MDDGAGAEIEGSGQWRRGAQSSIDTAGGEMSIGMQ